VGELLQVCKRRKAPPGEDDKGEGEDSCDEGEGEATCDAKAGVVRGVALISSAEVSADCCEISAARGVIRRLSCGVGILSGAKRWALVIPTPALYCGRVR